MTPSCRKRRPHATVYGGILLSSASCRGNRKMDCCCRISPDSTRSTREWRAQIVKGNNSPSPTDLRAALLNLRGGCFIREFPFLWRLDESNCVEGVIDLALFDQRAGGRWLGHRLEDESRSARDEVKTSCAKQYRPHWPPIGKRLVK